MKGQQKISRGLGFRGALNYDLGHDQPQIVGGNMSGATARELAKEFGQSRRIRGDIQKPVWRNSLSLPRGETLAPSEWVKILDDYMSEMGFDDDHQRIYVVHNKPGQQHAHITASRISMSGCVYLGQNENLKSTKIIHDLEKKYGLTPTACASTPKPRRTPKKPEIEKAIRTLVKPPRTALADAIDRVLQTDRPRDPEALKTALATKGVEVEFFTENGETKGVTFRLNGLKFSGSALGPAYKFPAIQERIKNGTTNKTPNHPDIAERFGNGPTDPSHQNPKPENPGDGKKGLVARKSRRATEDENKTFQDFLRKEKTMNDQKTVGALTYRKRHPAPVDPDNLDHGWVEFQDRKGKVWFYPSDEPPRAGNLSGYSWQPPTQTTAPAICAYNTAINKVGLEQAARDVVRIAVFKGLPEPVSTSGTDDFRRAVAKEMFRINIQLADLDGPAKQEFDRLHKMRHEELEKQRHEQVNSISSAFSQIDDQASQAHRAALARAAEQQEDTPPKKDDRMRMGGPR